jgi:symplekin
MAVRPQELNPNTAPLGVDEDEDEYEPDFNMAEDTEQILNRLDGEGVAKSSPAGEADALVPFTLPRPPPPTSDEAMTIGKDAASRVLDSIRMLPEQATKRQRPGFAHARPGAGLFGRDRDSWIKLVCRIATRATPAADPTASVKQEGAALVSAQEPSVGNHVRQFLYQYVLEDFRKRIDSAITWLCEEWYADWRTNRGRGGGGGGGGSAVPSFPNYETWALRLIDGFLPYVNAQDKLLTRFLSEIPHVNAAMLARVKQLCRDPSVVSLALNSLLYLIMLKPPAREVALDTIQDIWTDYDDAKTLAAKYLQRYRPEFLAAMKQRAAATAESVPAAA